MKKYIVIIALALIGCSLFACMSDKPSGNGDNKVNNDVENIVKMTAIIKNIDDKIEVEVIEGEYGAFGIYWVNVGSDTIYLDENGSSVKKSSLKIGDTVEITYGGQVMMSYPPQIVAQKIQIK